MKRKFYPRAHAVFGVKATLIACLYFLFLSPAQAQTYTMFTPAEYPGDVNFQDAGNTTGGIELGMKFRVTQRGNVSAIRFYLGDVTVDNGTHTGNLWLLTSATTGNKLATVTFAPVAPPFQGWVEATLPTPINVTDAATYAVSVHCSAGYYCSSPNLDPLGFLNELDRTPLIGLGNSDPMGPNGCFLYTATSAFPSAGSNGPNYFVDVVFTTAFPLPVTLTEFNSSVSRNDVLLSWKTQSEQNNKGFEIQRSTDGTNWSVQGFVEGVGESSTTQSYSYTDDHVTAGRYYYRLAQQDFDGAVKYSPVVIAVVAGETPMALHPNYPNPAHGVTMLRFDLSQSSAVRLSLLDITGREVKRLVNENRQAGSYVLSLNTAALNKGVYVIRLQAEGKILTRKMFVQ